MQLADERDAALGESAAVQLEAREELHVMASELAVVQLNNDGLRGQVGELCRTLSCEAEPAARLEPGQQVSATADPTPDADLL